MSYQTGSRNRFWSLEARGKECPIGESDKDIKIIERVEEGYGTVRVI